MSEIKKTENVSDHCNDDTDHPCPPPTILIASIALFIVIGLVIIACLVK